MNPTPWHAKTFVAGGTREILPLLAAVAFCLSAASHAAAASILLNNGLTPPNAENVIDDADSYVTDLLWVRNAGCGESGPIGAECEDPGAPTAIELVDGGRLRGISIYDTSSFEISGGTVDGFVNAHGSSSVTIHGGTEDTLSADDTSNVAIRGGIMQGLVEARESSSMAISGGTIRFDVFVVDDAIVAASGGTAESFFVALDDASLLITGDIVSRGSVQTLDDSTAFVTGGDFQGSLTSSGSSHAVFSGGLLRGQTLSRGDSTLSIRGGTIQDNLEAHDNSNTWWSGGDVDRQLVARHTAVVTILGSEFQVNGAAVGYGPIDKTGGQLRGTLVNGDVLDLQFSREADATIALAVPPPVFTSKAIRSCGAAKLRSYAAGMARAAKCHRSVARGLGSLARKESRLSDAALAAARDKLESKFEACMGKKAAKLDRGLLKAQARVEKTESDACTLGESDYNAFVEVFNSGVQRFVAAAAPGYREDERNAICLAAAAAALKAVGKYAKALVKSQSKAMRLGLGAGSNELLESATQKARDKLNASLAKIDAKNTKRGAFCNRAPAENLAAIVQNLAYQIRERGLGVEIP